MNSQAKHGFNEAKVASVVALISLLWPAITPALLAKVLFFADRCHLRGYGRPVTGVRYFATTNGPVPAGDLSPGELRFDLLSETDVTAVNKAVSFCHERSLTELNALIRQEPAWIAAPTGGEIDLALLVPRRMRKQVREVLAYRVKRAQALRFLDQSLAGLLQLDDPLRQSIADALAGAPVSHSGFLQLAPAQLDIVNLLLRHASTSCPSGPGSTSITTPTASGAVGGSYHVTEHADSPWVWGVSTGWF